MQEELCICAQFVFEGSDAYIILQMSSLKELTFRFWLTGTFWFLPMSLMGQKPGGDLDVEKHNEVVSFMAATRQLL